MNCHMLHTRESCERQSQQTCLRAYQRKQIMLVGICNLKRSQLSLFSGIPARNIIQIQQRRWMRIRFSLRHLGPRSPLPLPRCLFIQLALHHLHNVLANHWQKLEAMRRASHRKLQTFMFRVRADEEVVVRRVCVPADSGLNPMAVCEGWRKFAKPVAQLRFDWFGNPVGGIV